MQLHILETVSYDILGIVCIHLLYVRIYVCVHDVLHHHHMPCSRHMTIQFSIKKNADSVEYRATDFFVYCFYRFY